MIFSETKKTNASAEQNSKPTRNDTAAVAPGRSDFVSKNEVAETNPLPDQTPAQHLKQITEAVHTAHLFKHHLQNTCTLWYLEYDRFKSLEATKNKIASFDTAEDFCSLYKYIKPPSEINPGCDYSLLKKDIRAMWENGANKQSGRWVIIVNKSDLNGFWLIILLSVIGEAFNHSDQICGAVVNIRAKSYTFSIWTANGNNKEPTLEISHTLRYALRLTGHNILHYELHKS